jgi:hypothetical protein
LEIIIVVFYLLVGFSVMLMAHWLYGDRKALNRFTDEKTLLEKRITELERQRIEDKKDIR